MRAGPDRRLERRPYFPLQKTRPSLRELPSASIQIPALPALSSVLESSIPVPHPSVSVWNARPFRGVSASAERKTSDFQTKRTKYLGNRMSGDLWTIAVHSAFSRPPECIGTGRVRDLRKNRISHFFERSGPERSCGRKTVLHSECPAVSEFQVKVCRGSLHTTSGIPACGFDFSFFPLKKSTIPCRANPMQPT